MANGTGAAPQGDSNDLLSQILATLQRMESGGKGDGGGAPGSKSGKGWKSNADDFGGMVKEVQDKANREIANLPKKYRDSLGKYTVEVEHPELGSMKRSWLHLQRPQQQSAWNTLGYSQPPTMAQAAGDAGAAALKPLAASLAMPISLGFGEALGKTRGWKEMDDGLQRTARNLRDTGTGLGKLAGVALSAFGMISTGPLALAGGAIGAVAGLHATASYAFGRQAQMLAPYNGSVATTSMMLEMGDIRRSIELGSRVERSFGELGGALGAFRDTLVPIQAFGLNAVNKAGAFGLGAANQGINQLLPMMPMLPAMLGGAIGNAAGGGLGVVGGLGDAGAFMGHMAVNVPKQIVQHLGNLMAGQAVGQNPLGVMAGLPGAIADAFGAALNDPAMKADLDLRAKARRAIPDFLEEIERMSLAKPSNVLGAGMAQAGIEAMKAAAKLEDPIAAARAGFQQGMRDEEQRVRAAEAKDQQVMGMWAGRLYNMSAHHMANRFPLRAQGVAGNQARQRRAWQGLMDAGGVPPDIQAWNAAHGNRLGARPAAPFVPNADPMGPPAPDFLGPAWRRHSNQKWLARDVEVERRRVADHVGRLPMLNYAP